MGAFWDIIQRELDRDRFDVSDRKIARALDVSPSTIRNWRDGLTNLPTVKNLRAVAAFAGVEYEDVLFAALSDTGHAAGTGIAVSMTTEELQAFLDIRAGKTKGIPQNVIDSLRRKRLI